MIALRKLFLDAAIQILVLEEQHAVLVPDGRLYQALRVARRGWIDNLEAGRMEEGRLGILRMKRAAPDVSTAGPAHDHRAGQERAVAGGGHIVREHIVGAGDEIDELTLAYR